MLVVAVVIAAVALVAISHQGSHQVAVTAGVGSVPSGAAPSVAGGTTPGPGPTQAVPTTSVTAAPSAAGSSTAAAVSTTTIDPGTLPQTQVLPTADDPAFLARMADLWQAITSGDAALGQPAFFPLSAYIQVKGISDPVHDYQTRLIPDYVQDIDVLHRDLGAEAGTATFAGVRVPNTAQWILPGVEYNKGSYYRVYDSALVYSSGGIQHTFGVASMISWRGEWYVVHLNSIR